MSGLNDAARRLKAFGASVQQLGRQMAMFGIGAAIPIGLSVRRFAEFDDKMREVQAVTQSTDAQLQRLTATARTLGQTTSFTAVEVASLMAELGRADFDAVEIERATEAVLNLARATVTDATLAASVMVRTMKQFGLASEEAARVSDALTIAANRSVSTVESLGESLEYTGPVARQFGMSLEDTLAVLGTLGNIGIEGSNAGTALRRLLILTGTQAQQMRDLFGVEANDAAGNARPLVDMLDEISRSIEHLGTAERQAKLFDLFGFLGITAASGVGDNLGNVRELADALATAGGAAGEAARRMDAGIGGTFRRLRGAVENLALSIGESLDMALRSLGQTFRVSLNDMANWIRENKGMVIGITLAVTAIISLGVALIGLGVAIKLVGFAIGALGAVLAIVGGAFQIVLSLIMGIISPVGLMTAAIIAAGAAWLTTSENGKAAAEALATGFSGVAETARTAFAGIMEALELGDIQGSWTIAIAGMRLAWLQLTEAITAAWARVVDSITSTFPMLTRLMSGLGHVFTSAWRGFNAPSGQQIQQTIQESSEQIWRQMLMNAVRNYDLTGDQRFLDPQEIINSLPAGVQLPAEFLNVNMNRPAGQRVQLNLARIREMMQATTTPAATPAVSPEIQAAQQALDNAIANMRGGQEFVDTLQRFMDILNAPATPPAEQQRIATVRGMPGMSGMGLMMGVGIAALMGVAQTLERAEQRVATAATFSGTLAASGGLEFGDQLGRVMQDQLGVQRRIERNTRIQQLFR